MDGDVEAAELGGHHRLDGPVEILGVQRERLRGKGERRETLAGLPKDARTTRGEGEHTRASVREGRGRESERREGNTHHRGLAIEPDGRRRVGGTSSRAIG